MFSVGSVSQLAERFLDGSSMVSSWERHFFPRYVIKMLFSDIPRLVSLLDKWRKIIRKVIHQKLMHQNSILAFYSQSEHTYAPIHMDTDRQTDRHTSRGFLSLKWQIPQFQDIAELGEAVPDNGSDVFFHIIHWRNIFIRSFLSKLELASVPPKDQVNVDEQNEHSLFKNSLNPHQAQETCSGPAVDKQELSWPLGVTLFYVTVSFMWHSG